MVAGYASLMNWSPNRKLCRLLAYRHTPVICYTFRQSDRVVRVSRGSWRVQNLKTTAALQALPGVRCGGGGRLPRPVVYTAAWREGPILGLPFQAVSPFPSLPSAQSHLRLELPSAHHGNPTRCTNFTNLGSSRRLSKSGSTFRSSILLE